MSRFPDPATYEPPVQGETSREARERRQRNRDAQQARAAYMDARCSFCGHVRIHVGHETDPDTSPEGPAYHAEFAHHEFVETPR